MNIIIPNKHCQSMNVNQFINHILSAFQHKYPILLNDLSGFRAKGFYLRNANNTYHSIHITSVDQVIDLEDHVYIDIVSDEVWAKLNMTITIGNQISKLQNEVKLERMIQFNRLTTILLKIMITSWNYAYTQRKYKEKQKEIILMKEYMNLHYLITEFTSKVYSNSEMIFDWDKEKYHNCFSINININAKMKTIEEMVVNLLQNEIDGISIEKVKMVWSDFVELKSFDELILSSKLVTEYVAIKTFIKTHCIANNI